MPFFVNLVISTLLVTFFAIVVMYPISHRIKLIDVPKGRKQHLGNIPLIGGIAIFCGMAVTSLTYMHLTSTLLVYLGASLIVLIVGVWDDRCDLSVRFRMGIQVLASLVLMFGTDLYLKELGYIFGFNLSLGYIGIPFTVIAILGAINAFNMMDGLDGLVGSVSIVTFSALAYLLFEIHSNWYMVALIFIFNILVYLFFNLSLPFSFNRKIFMGDAGSMLIGLTIVWLLVLSTQRSVVAFRPVLALYLIAIPLMDMAAIMMRRVRNGDSPFKADRNHLHHMLLRLGMRHRRVLICITLLAAVIAVFGMVLESYAVPEYVMLIVFLALFYGYCKVTSKLTQAS